MTDRTIRVGQSIACSTPGCVSVATVQCNLRIDYFTVQFTGMKFRTTTVLMSVSIVQIHRLTVSFFADPEWDRYFIINQI